MAVEKANLTSSSDSYAQRQFIAWQDTTKLAKDFKKQLISSIKRVLKKRGVPLYHYRAVFQDYMIRQFELLLTEIRLVQVPNWAAHARCVARIVAHEYCSSLTPKRNRATVRGDLADVVVDVAPPPHRIAPLLEAMEEFRRNFETILRHLPTIDRLVAVTYAWHWVNHHGERVPVDDYLELVNLELVNTHKLPPISKSDFENAKRRAMRLLKKELEHILNKIKDLRNERDE